LYLRVEWLTMKVAYVVMMCSAVILWAHRADAGWGCGGRYRGCGPCWQPPCCNGAWYYPACCAPTPQTTPQPEAAKPKECDAVHIVLIFGTKDSDEGVRGAVVASQKAILTMFRDQVPPKLKEKIANGTLTALEGDDATEEKIMAALDKIPSR